MEIEEKRIIGLIIIFLSIICLILMISKMYLFGFILLIIDGALIFYYINKLVDNRNEYSRYNSKVKSILKTYDAILVEINDIPVIAGNSIVRVTNFKDLVDAQYEIRKPIYFKNYDNSCGFILMSDKEICLYIVKLNNDIVCPLEEQIEKSKGIDKDSIEKFLNSFDKTGVIKINNDKSYKISPIKKIEEVKEENNEVINKNRSIITNGEKLDFPAFKVQDK